MTFVIFYDGQPRKFLRKIDKAAARRILDRIDDILIKDPVPHDAKAIVGEHGVFRIGMGEYRALYRINHESDRIIVFKIDKRSRIY